MYLEAVTRSLFRFDFTAAPPRVDNRAAKRDRLNFLFAFFRWSRLF
jgi:hypothetical protein